MSTHKTNRHKIITILYYFIFAVVATYYVYGALHYPAGDAGESDDYILPTISLTSHFSDDVRPSDIEQAFVQYPEHRWIWERWRDKKDGMYAIDSKGNRYTFYFPTYSILVLPFIYMVKFIGIPQLYAFHLANAVYFLLALLTVFKTRLPEPHKLLAILIFAASPIAFYILWASAEVVICSLLIGCLACLFSKKYKSSMLFYALASTLNITIAPFCLFIYFKFLNDTVESFYLPSKLVTTIKNNFLSICKLFAINCIIFIPVIINYYRFGRPVTMSFGGTTNLLLDRFIAYVLDLNFGLLPYFPLILLSIPLVFLLTSKKVEYTVFIIVSTCIMLAFSLMIHINCGITAIHRYVAWASVFYIFGTLYYASHIHKSNARRIVCVLFFASFVYTFAISSWYGLIEARYIISCLKFTPFAKYVLDTMPGLYNPLFSTFQSRVNHRDGGYDYLEHLPIVYKDDDGYIHKVLLSKNDIETFRNELSYPKELAAFVDQEFAKCSEDEREIQYLNFPKGVKKLSFLYTPTTHLAFTAQNPKLKDYLVPEQWSHPEDRFTWTIGRTADLVFRIHPTPQADLQLQIVAGVVGHREIISEQTVDVFANGEKIATWHMKRRQTYTAVFPARLLDASGNLHLRFTISNPRSPKELGINNDTRKLGIAVESLVISERRVSPS